MKAEDDIKGALEGLQKVLSMETEKGDWGFKALKQMVKLTFSKVGVTLCSIQDVLSYT